MAITCKHCGTRYIEFAGHDGFCCRGCAQVYRLIQDEGLGDYYNLQDRIGKPPVTESEEKTLQWASRLQAQAEAKAKTKATGGNASIERVLSVHGMTCMGCAWLIEKLARTHAGVVSARVELESHTVTLRWQAEVFDLPALVREWARFGYQAVALEARKVPKISPLLWRICLCALFSINGLLLSALPQLGLDASAFKDLLRLLELFFVAMSIFVGASFFVLPVYQSLRLSRLHYDLLPALGCGVALVVTAVGLVEWPLWYTPFFITALLFARWVHRSQWRQAEVAAHSVDPRQLRWLQVYVGLFATLSGLVCMVVSPQASVSMLFAASLYPFARGVSGRPSVLFSILVLSFASAGAVLGYGAENAWLALVWLLASGVICNFLFFRCRCFSDRSVS